MNNIIGKDTITIIANEIIASLILIMFFLTNINSSGITKKGKKKHAVT